MFIALTGHAAEEDETERRGGRARRWPHELARLTASDTLVLARRNLMRIPRQPDLLIAYTIQPVMFVLLFVYVFGGAIQTPGFDYVDFLMPGIIVQSIAFGGFVTALGLSEDVQKGLIDRFRSLPMSRAAVLAGRTFSDIVLNCLSLVVLLAVGFAAGFNFSDTTAGADRARDRAAAAARLRVLVDLRAGRAVLVVAGDRELDRLHADLPAHVRLVGVRAGGDDARRAAAVRRGEPVHDDGPTRCARSGSARRAHTDVWMSFVWCFVLIAVFAPLAVARYRKVAAK